MSIGSVGKVVMGAAYSVAANAGEYSQNLADAFIAGLEEKKEIAYGSGLAVIEQAKDTILSAAKEAAKTVYDAVDGMAQGIVSGAMVAGSSVYGLVKSGATDAMGRQIDNINGLKNSLGTQPPQSNLLNGNSGSPLHTDIDQPLPFKEQFDAAKKLPLEKRAELFNDQAGDPHYFENAAVEFNKLEPAELDALRADLDGLAGQLKTKMSMTSDETQSIVRSGQAVGSALGQAIGGGIKFASSEAVLEKGRYDAAQAFAENTKNFYDTLNSSIDQMMSKFAQAWGDLLQTVRSVVQTSGQV